MNQRLICCFLFAVGFSTTARADGFHVLHTFAPGEGGSVYDNLTVAGGTVYGTVANGGPYQEGTLVSMYLDGSNFQTVHTFEFPLIYPSSPIVAVGSTLYGAANLLYSINADGSNIQIVNIDNAEDQFSWHSGLTEIGSRLFAAGSRGDPGAGAYDAIFSANFDGSDAQTVHVFTGLDGNGYHPSGILTQVGATLFGVTTDFYDEPTTLFSMSLDGSNFQTLHTFNWVMNGMGQSPDPHLTIVGSTVYGVTKGEESCLFSINLDGSHFQVLHAFSSSFPHTDIFDGGSPTAGLTLVGSKFYGMQALGGPDGLGAIFSINLDGSGYQVVHAFSASEGVPTSGLTLQGSTLYGATSAALIAYTVPEPSAAFLAALGALAILILKRCQVR